jgi:hypothetical protein
MFANKLRDGLAKGNAANLKPVCEKSLGLQPISRLQSAAADLAFEMGRELAV